MDMAQTYNIVVEQGEDGYLIAEVIELPGCRTQAKTQEELVKRIKEAIKGYLKVKSKDEPKTKFLSVQQIEV